MNLSLAKELLEDKDFLKIIEALDVLISFLNNIFNFLIPIIKCAEVLMKLIDIKLEI